MKELGFFPFSFIIFDKEFPVWQLVSSSVFLVGVLFNQGIAKSEY